MADNEWLGYAVPVPQITTSTVSGTWATNDTATLTINSKDLVVKVGTPTTTADVATLITNAFNATDRLNAATGSSNVGGQSIPEFAEIIASVSGSVITFTHRSKEYIGEPFTITVADTSASGTLGSPTTTQAATGPNDWANVDNWSLGVAPDSATNTVANFRNGKVDCLDNLPNNSLEIQINVYNSYEGRIGRPAVNRKNTSRPYNEYRRTHVRLDDAGPGTTATHNIGIGDGPGPKLVNIKHSTLPTTFNVDINSKPDEATNGAGSKVVNVICAAGLTANVRKGSVNLSDQDGATASVTAINITGKEGQVGDIDVVSRKNSSTACTVSQIGGKLLIDWATWSTNGLTQRGGQTIVYTCGIPSAQISNGTLVYVAASGGSTIAALTGNKQGVLDVSQTVGTVTITNATYYAGFRVVNPGKRITHTNAIQTYGLSSEVAANLDYGYNRTIQIAG